MPAPLALPSTRLKYVVLVWLTVVLSGCGGTLVAPTPQCAYDRTGDLVLVSLAGAGGPPDVYVDGHSVTTLPHGGECVVPPAAADRSPAVSRIDNTRGTRDV